MNPEEKCRCGHELKWHNSCSKCYCPGFLPKDIKTRALVAEWTHGMEMRMAHEGAER